MLVSLTTDGRRTVDRLPSAIGDIQDAVFGGLSAAERATLLGLLGRPPPATPAEPLPQPVSQAKWADQSVKQMVP